MINELQGLRGIARLARMLQEQGDSRWQTYFDYADQVISFYAMMGDAVPRIDSASDKRVHYIISALELYRASGEQRFLDWATALQGEVLGLTVKEVDGDFLAFAVGIGSYLDDVNDTSHANREAEMVRYWTEEDTPGTSDFMRRAVNTLLFRIWENQPIVQPADQYPYLFRNMTDGDNSCQGVNSPYRLGSVDVGWNELARYDRRVLYIMERFTDALVEGTAAISFPAPADCTLNGNTNYSYIITAIAELAYAHTYTVPSTAGSPLLITSAANVSVAENRTAVLTVMTTAAAGTTPTFLLNGGADAAWFAIDSATGVLTFTSGRD